MKIRPARETDLQRIIDIRHKAFSRMAPQTYSPVEVDTLLQDYTEDEFLRMIAEERLFVATRGSDIYGTAGWEEKNIRHVYVDPDSFGRGIGTLLVAHAEADYRERTQHPNIKAGVILYARGFYEKCGYQVVIKAKAWDGSDYYSMRKDFAK